MVGIGIPKLDAQMTFPDNANILLIGPPGDEKTALAMQYIGDALKKKQPCVYITTDLAPMDIENRASKYGHVFFSHTGKDLYFVDCYSWTLGNKKKGKKRDDIQVPGPSALNDMSIGIAQAVQQAFKKPENNKAVFQSLSTLLLYNNPEIVFRFVQITGARLKGAGTSTLFLLESGMHEEKAVTTLKHLMDGFIEIKNEGGRLMLNAPQNGVSDWIEFKLGKAGIQI